MMKFSPRRFSPVLVAIALVAASGDVVIAKSKKESKGDKDPYAEYVWPQPPDKGRIKLEKVIQGRADVVAKGKLKRRLLGSAAQSPYDNLNKPYAVAFDNDGRILVTDTMSSALIRYDLGKREMDVFGTQGAVRLKTPMGIGVGPEGTIFIADVGLGKVIGLDSEGTIVAAIGHEGDLENPTDVAVSPDGKKVFVADSKAHRIVIFDRESGDRLSSFGKRGAGEGEFAWPTSLTFGPEGSLFVVDQINCRVQVFDADGEYRDQFGQRGQGFGQFARPKGIVVDEVGFIYVVDAVFDNFQIFDADFSLLTFVGSGGRSPGRFYGASGIDVRGDQIVVVDQLGARVQIFKFIVPKDE